MAAFKRFVDASEDADREEAFQLLCSLRADLAVHYAFGGFGISYEDAIELIQSKEDLTPEQSARRDILIAAVDNIVDFATAEEYHAISELPDDSEDDGSDEEGEEDLDDEETEEAILAICSKYNKRYANVENHDIEYAMIVAAELAALSDDSYLMYMTMGDERVRPWHLQYEGYTAPKSSFPGWLVPPIEHGCRCYLLEDGRPSAQLRAVQSSKVIAEPPFWFNPTFKECVAFGGRIFSDEHPYFNIPEEHIKPLAAISDRIKQHYWNAKD